MKKNRKFLFFSKPTFISINLSASSIPFFISFILLQFPLKPLRKELPKDFNFPTIPILFRSVASHPWTKELTRCQLVGYAKRSVKLALSLCVRALMQTGLLAGNRRASIRFKSGASNSHANTRSGGARVHDRRRETCSYDSSTAR